MPRGGQCVIDHVAGGGLSVCSGHDHDLHSLGYRRKNVSGKLHRDDARYGRAAAAGLSEERTGRFAGRDRQHCLESIWSFHDSPLFRKNDRL